MFFVMFFGLWLENVRISSVSFRQLWQNCIYVSIGMFWGKQLISERDVFFREFYWKILVLRWNYFRRFVKTTFIVSRGKLSKGNFWEVIFSQFQIFWEFCGGFFRNASWVSRVFFWIKLSLVLETQKFVIQFQLWSKKNLPFLQNTLESSV